MHTYLLKQMLQLASCLHINDAVSMSTTTSHLSSAGPKPPEEKAEKSAGSHTATVSKVNKKNKAIKSV